MLNDRVVVVVGILGGGVVQRGYLPTKWVLQTGTDHLQNMAYYLFLLCV